MIFEWCRCCGNHCYNAPRAGSNTSISKYWDKGVNLGYVCACCLMFNFLIPFLDLE